MDAILVVITGASEEDDDLPIGERVLPLATIARDGPHFPLFSTEDAAETFIVAEQLDEHPEGAALQPVEDALTLLAFLSAAKQQGAVGVVVDRVSATEYARRLPIDDMIATLMEEL